MLIVDDEENIGRSLRMILEREGYAVSTLHSLGEFHNAKIAADAYLLDVRLPDGTGVDILRSIRQTDQAAPVIMISGHGTIADAVEATRAGAFDFLEKPLGREKVLVTLKNALEQSSLREENERLREMVGGSPQMIGASPAWARVVEQASMAARSDARVLLTGESGTGKELLAEHVHRESPFASGPFVKVNCAAIPTDLLESELFGHERVPTPEPPECAAASSSLPMAAAFWMRLAICMPDRRQNYCEFFKKVNFIRWEESRLYA